jgi:hypothetical protein
VAWSSRRPDRPTRQGQDHLTTASTHNQEFAVSRLTGRSLWPPLPVSGLLIELADGCKWPARRPIRPRRWRCLEARFRREIAAGVETIDAAVSGAECRAQGTRNGGLHDAAPRTRHGSVRTLPNGTAATSSGHRIRFIGCGIRLLPLSGGAIRRNRYGRGASSPNGTRHLASVAQNRSWWRSIVATNGQREAPRST